LQWRHIDTHACDEVPVTVGGEDEAQAPVRGNLGVFTAVANVFAISLFHETERAADTSIDLHLLDRARCRREQPPAGDRGVEPGFEDARRRRAKAASDPYRGMRFRRRA